jgi:dTDP-4-dehydrorhamnose 3,5-epimerase-like enzyme
LSQGELAQCHDSELGIHYLAALELKQHSVRGNHLHHTKVEHLYLMRGEIELVAQEMASGELAQLVLQAGDLAIIQPGVAHAFKVLQSGFALEFAPTRFDPADIHPHPLIQA